PTFAIVGNTAYLADGNHYLNGWNLYTGRQVVHQELPGMVSMDGPAVVGNQMYLGYLCLKNGGGVVDYNWATQHIVWSTQNINWVQGESDANLLVHDGVIWEAGNVRTASGAVDAEVMMLNAQTGSVLHTLDLGPAQYVTKPGPHAGQFTAADGLIYYTSPDTNELVALSPYTGQMVWHFPLYYNLSDVLVTGMNVYVPTLSGDIDIVNALTGKEVGRQVFPHGVFYEDSPIQINNHLVISWYDVATHQGHVTSEPLPLPTVQLPTSLNS
ncbi:MAG: PQQ-binding-like beta-propeller repeat protein, partial [Firmicutes bacterium]|nr:PQQ-binding-like beta-propeller repeat protein [Bacillota bacterium]